MLISYTRFQKIWQKRGKSEEEIEEWWIDWNDVAEEAGEWDNPRRFEVLDQFVVDEKVCESAFRESK